MVTARTEGFDHMTIVVTDLPEARRFFGLLGFEESLAVVASGERVADYMGIPGWESDHVTLVLKGVDVHQEIQLLFFHQPPIKVDAGTGTLDRTGFNHVCFRVNDMAAMLRAPGGQRDHAPERGPRLPRRASWCSSTGRASSWSWPSGPAGEPAGQRRSRSMSTCTAWRDGRADECTALEKLRGASLRGFESHSLRFGVARTSHLTHNCAHPCPTS